MKNDYRFIVVCIDTELYDSVYSQLNELSYAHFDNHYPHTYLEKKLYKVHFSDRVNNIIELPFKEIWIDRRINYYSKILSNMDTDNEKLCFILFSDCLQLEQYGFSKKLKTKFPDCRIVYYFQDLISQDVSKQVFIKNIPSQIDLVYTFDYADAENYGLEFHDIPYSYPQKESCENVQYDISFVGAAKNRLNDIIAVYEKLKKQNLKSFFYIVGADDKAKESGQDFVYGPPLKYYDYLKIVEKSKCILEIMQKEGTGSTIRLGESIMYDKLLISNNKALKKSAFYNPQYMLCIDDDDYSSISEFVKQYPIVQKSKEEILPENLLLSVKERLDEKFGNENI